MKNLFNEIQAIRDEKTKKYAMRNYIIATRDRIKVLIDERIENLGNIAPRDLENEVAETMEMADKVDQLDGILADHYNEVGVINE